MIVQKLRLQHGWSQQQLAEMSGLSARTIQRIENGKTPSVESVKSLAAVFEVDFSTLNGAFTMDTRVNNEVATTELQLSKEEKQAYKHVRRLKNFYLDLTVFFIAMVVLVGINWFTSTYWWTLWVFLGWGSSFVIRAFYLFVDLPFFGADWEQRQLNKRLKK